MRFVSYVHGTAPSYGLLDGDTVLDLPKAAGGVLPGDLLGLIAAGPQALAAVRHAAESGGSRAPLSSIKLTAPIPRPSKNVFCVGRNYTPITRGSENPWAR